MNWEERQSWLIVLVVLYEGEEKREKVWMMKMKMDKI